MGEEGGGTATGVRKTGKGWTVRMLSEGAGPPPGSWDEGIIWRDETKM